VSTISRTSPRSAPLRLRRQTPGDRLAAVQGECRQIQSKRKHELGHDVVTVQVDQLRGDDSGESDRKGMRPSRPRGCAAGQESDDGQDQEHP
jgi:hypothetical protein